MYCSRKIVSNLNRIDQFIGLIPTIIEFDRKAAIEFGKIQGELRNLGKPTGEMDALIAVIARSRGDIIITNNTCNFIEILHIQLEDWL